VSNLIEAPRPSLLSDQSLGVVEATAPVVAAHADEITAHFYPRMFAAHPELLRVFNQGNQATGAQSKALAGSVVAYAVQLIDPKAPSFDHVMRRIAYKHVSLGIRPEQYTIVGEHLLASVAEVLGDAVTPRSPRPGARSIGCSRSSWLPRKRGSTSRRTWIPRNRLAPTAWSAE
jgi:hemoglobin-like flavoprotein